MTPVTPEARAARYAASTHWDDDPGLDAARRATVAEDVAGVIRAAVSAEREACAGLIERLRRGREFAQTVGEIALDKGAAAIRGRGTRGVSR